MKMNNRILWAILPQILLTLLFLSIPQNSEGSCIGDPTAPSCISDTDCGYPAGCCREVTCDNESWGYHCKYNCACGGKVAEYYCGTNKGWCCATGQLTRVGACLCGGSCFPCNSGVCQEDTPGGFRYCFSSCISGYCNDSGLCVTQCPSGEYCSNGNCVQCSCSQVLAENEKGTYLPILLKFGEVFRTKSTKGKEFESASQKFDKELGNIFALDEELRFQARGFIQRYIEIFREVGDNSVSQGTRNRVFTPGDAKTLRIFIQRIENIASPELKDFLRSIEPYIDQFEGHRCGEILDFFGLI